ncbi:MAG: HopA1 effector protein family [Rhizobacter sp.]|nr:HopA1 effector protein family [Rhizobacter sp.]
MGQCTDLSPSELFEKFGPEGAKHEEFGMYINDDRKKETPLARLSFSFNAEDGTHALHQMQRMFRNPEFGEFKVLSPIFAGKHPDNMLGYLHKRLNEKEILKITKGFNVQTPSSYVQPGTLPVGPGIAYSEFADPKVTSHNGSRAAVVAEAIKAHRQHGGRVSLERCMDRAFHDAGYDHRKPWKVRE